MKNIYLLHGWRENPESTFLPWLKSELISRGYTVAVPSFPHADAPVVEEWVSFIKSLLTNRDEETVVIGHSLGGTALLKYLETMNGERPLKIAILVAPAIGEATNIPDAAKALALPWLEMSLDEEKVKKSAGKIVGFFSDNDHRVPLHTEKVLKERFGAITFIEHEKGHYAHPEEKPDLDSLMKILSE